MDEQKVQIMSASLPNLHSHSEWPIEHRNWLPWHFLWSLIPDHWSPSKAITYTVITSLMWWINCKFKFRFILLWFKFNCFVSYGFEIDAKKKDTEHERREWEKQKCKKTNRFSETESHCHFIASNVLWYTRTVRNNRDNREMFVNLLNVYRDIVSFLQL